MYIQTQDTIHVYGIESNITSRAIFGAIKEDKVTLFSGGIPAFDAAAITTVSPLSTSLMIPLNHVGADDTVMMDQHEYKAVVYEQSDRLID